MQQLIYKHYSNGNYYKIVDHCLLQIDDAWVDAYIYVDATKSSAVYTQKFARPVVEFHSKFSPVLNEQELHSIQDGESLLDKLRQGQLASIFGKYKLF